MTDVGDVYAACVCSFAGMEFLRNSYATGYLSVIAKLHAFATNFESRWVNVDFFGPTVTTFLNGLNTRLIVWHCIAYIVLMCR